MPESPKGFDPNQMLGMPEVGGHAEIWIGNGMPATTAGVPSTEAPSPAASTRVLLGKAPETSTSQPAAARPAARAKSSRPPVDQAKLPPYLRGHPAFRS
jgi:hypothetical protein